MKIYDKTFEDMFSPITKRIIGAFTTFFFTFAICSPSALACYTNIKEQKKKEKYEQNILTLSKVNPVGEQLKSIFEMAKDLDKELSLAKPDQNKIDQLSVSLKQTADKLKQLDEVEKTALTTEIKRIKDKNLSKLHFSRQKDFNEHYESHMAKVFDALSNVLAKLKSNEQLGKSDISKLIASVDYPVARQNQSTNSELNFVEAPPRDMYTTQSQINGLLGVTGSEEWELDDYLATDSATQSSDIIEQKVAELGADPVQLYNWVYNNVKFIPSYGVMQGADYTMQTKQGNAFDISSTLVSMFRTADIPARFNYGVVALDAKKVQNWVGGVKNIGAATNLISQGGIPHRQITFGGNTEEIEIEHVWVEAYIDGEWHSFDPSFKQYEYKEGIDIAEEVPFDQEIFAQTINDSTTVDQSGWMKFNAPNAINESFASYRDQVVDHLENNHADATFGDFLGTQTIIQNHSSSANDIFIPFHRVQGSSSLPNLPESLFYKFRLQLGNTTGGSVGIPIEWSDVSAEYFGFTSSIIGKNLALSFRPATTEDANILESYLPDVIDSPDDLPSQVPANAVNMVGEITIDGNVVAASSQVTLGEAMMTRLGFEKPGNQWSFTENHIVAGEYYAIGIDMHGLSKEQFEDMQSNAEIIYDKLEAEDYSDMDRHDFTGLLLQTGVQIYFAETYVMNKLSSYTSNVAYYRQPSYGTFSTQLQVGYSFGAPRDVIINGVMMDIDRLQLNSESIDNCYDKWLAMNKNAGMLNSAYEHIIPERIFSEEGKPANGVSTAKALALAKTEGQKIYTLTDTNMNELNNIQIDDLGRSEISQALQLGYVVTVHEKPVLVNGWSGSGYSIIDPDYGVGAYKISGGANGQFLKTVDSNLEKMIDWISWLDEKSGKFKKLSKMLKFVTGKLKRLLENIRRIISIIDNCGLAGAILGVIMLAALIAVMAKIIAWSAAVTGFVCAGVGLVTGPLAFVCTLVVGAVIVGAAIDFANHYIEQTTNEILDGPFCKIGA